MIEEIKLKMNEEIEKVFSTLSNKLTKVRTGRANPAMLDPISVDYYGTMTPLKQVGQISTPEARLLQIQPFDKTLIPSIEKAILAANLGLTPSNDGNIVRIPFAALTEDTRKGIVKEIKKYGEEAKVQIRNVRREHNDQIKKSQKDKVISEDDSKKYQDEIQGIIDKHVKKVDDVISKKEQDVMTV